MTPRKASKPAARTVKRTAQERILSDHVEAEVSGARVFLLTCLLCGATLMIHPRDPFDPCAAHIKFHESLPRRTKR